MITRIQVGIVVVLVVTAVFLGLALAWRLGLNPRARQAGVTVRGGVGMAMMAASGLAVSAILVAFGGGDPFVIAISVLAGLVGLGATLTYLLAVRDRSAAVREAGLERRLAAAGAAAAAHPLGHPARSPW